MIPPAAPPNSDMTSPAQSALNDLENFFIIWYPGIDSVFQKTLRSCAGSLNKPLYLRPQILPLLIVKADDGAMF